MFGTVILFGAVGEILTEKSGNLNLGVPGIMYLGGIAGLGGAFYYEMSARGSLCPDRRAADRAAVRACWPRFSPGSSTAF